MPDMLKLQACPAAYFLWMLYEFAITHTPKDGRITANLQETIKAVKLSAQNTGETIPAEHLPWQFDRFYRVDFSRQRFTEGTGLGLAITRSIVEARGGEASVQSINGVTVFELSIPLQQ